MNRSRLVLYVLMLLQLSAVSAFGGSAPVSRWSFTSPSLLPNTAGGEDWFYGVVPLDDGSYLAAGYTQLTGQMGKISAVVAHVSAAKTLLKEDTFGGLPMGAVLFDITRTPTGYVAVGVSGSDVLVAGIDLALNVTWKTFSPATLGTPNHSLEGRSVRAVPGSSGGGVIIAGQHYAPNNKDGALLLRLDNSLNPITSFGPLNTGALVVDQPLKAGAQSVRVESGSGGDFFILAGNVENPTAGDPSDLYVAKVDAATAATVWSRTLSKAQLVGLGPYVDVVRPAVCPTQLVMGQPVSTQTTDREEADTAEVIPSSAGGGYLVAAQVNLVTFWQPTGCSNTAIMPSLVDLDSVLLRIDANGNPLWARQVGRFSGIDFRTPLVLHDDGAILIGNDALAGPVKISVIKTNLSGTQTWQGSYIIPGDTNDCVFGAAVTPDGSIVVAGNNNRNSDDYFLMKIGPARDLWMQDETPDAGDEPDPTSGPLWTSPEIWVRNFEDFYPWPNAHVHENPEYRDPLFQVPNYLYAEVRNRGVEPASGVLHFYYAKASTGLVWPSSWDGSTECCGTGTGFCSGEIPSPVTITNLLPGATQIVSVPWFPPNPATFQSCGLPQEKSHYCLLARIESSPASPTKGMAFAEGTSVNANTGANNNIVWKNVTIVDNFLGAGKMSQDSTLVHNVMKKPAAVTLAFTVPREEQKQPIFNFAQVEIVLSPKLLRQWTAGGRAATGVTGEGPVLQINGPRAELRNIRLEADQSEVLGIRIQTRKPARRPARASLSLDVLQLQDGKAVGGVRFTMPAKPVLKKPQPAPQPGHDRNTPATPDPRDPRRRPAEPTPGRSMKRNALKA